MKHRYSLNLLKRAGIAGILLLQSLLFFQVNAQQAKQAPPRVSKMAIYFEPFKKDLNSFNAARLDSLFGKWKDSTEYRVYITGFMDSTQVKERRDSLAGFRAKTVLSYLASKGIKVGQLKTMASDASAMVYKGAEKGLNRRVEIVIKYGVSKKQPATQPIAAAKKKPTPVKKPEPVVVENPEEQAVAGDSVIEVGDAFQAIFPRELLNEIHKNGWIIEARENPHTRLGAVTVYNGEEELYMLPKAVTYRFKLKHDMPKADADTLWYYDVDRNGLLKKITNKVKLESKKTGLWVKFRTKWIPTGGDGNFWARLRLGLEEGVYEGNSFVLESPGYRIQSIRLVIADDFIKDISFQRSLYQESATIKNYINSNCFVDRVFSWKDLSEKEWEIVLADKSGKKYIVHKTLMEFKHDMNNLKPELNEPKVHRHKKGCGHPGLTGGRFFFIRFGGNSKEIATTRIIPAVFTIRPQDMIDLSSEVKK